MIRYELELCLVGQGLNDGIELFTVLVDATLCQKFFCGLQEFVSFMVSCIPDLLFPTFQLLCLEALYSVMSALSSAQRISVFTWPPATASTSV